MLAYFVAFISGVITVLAPCVFPLLPIIIGNGSSGKSLKKLFAVVFSLSLSVFIFTILFRTLILDNPFFTFLNQDFWRYFSGILIAVFGLFSIFPELWNKISISLNLSTKSEKLLDKSAQKDSIWGSILLGASLGPVFSSCSPTYFVIIGLLATETDRFKGLILLLIYILGLATILILIGFFGFKIIKKLRGVANPNGWFKKSFGFFLVILGLMIVFKLDKNFETWLLNFEYYSQIFNYENELTEGGRKLM
jgi:cytochrome c-type biogenesis protein